MFERNYNIIFPFSPTNELSSSGRELNILKIFVNVNNGGVTVNKRGNVTVNNGLQLSLGGGNSKSLTDRQFQRLGGSSCGKSSQLNQLNEF